MTKAWPVYGALLLVQVLFGLWPVAGSIVLKEISPPALIGFRLFLGAPMILLLVKLMGKPWPTLRQLPQLAVLALFGIAANQLLYAEGLSRAGPINAVVLMCVIPVVTLSLAMALGMERPSKQRLVGVAVATLGVLLIVRVERFDLSDTKQLGNLFIIGNATCYATYLVLARRTVAEVQPLVLVAGIFFFGAIEASPWTLPAVRATDWTSLTTTSYLALVFILIGPTIGTYFLNAYALRQVDSSVVAIFISLQPIIGSVGAKVLLGEAASLRAMIATGLIVAGVLLSSLRGARPRTAIAGT